MIQMNEEININTQQKAVKWIQKFVFISSLFIYSKECKA